MGIMVMCPLVTFFVYEMALLFAGCISAVVGLSISFCGQLGLCQVCIPGVGSLITSLLGIVCK